MKTKILFFTAALLSLLSSALPAFCADKPASKPLYRDPHYDGAADSTLIWSPHDEAWLMFYTSRRANVAGLSGVAWVHGTPIGIALSRDGGTTWQYERDADIPLPSEIGGKEPTLWAPDVVSTGDGTYHMFLTVVPGVFEDWRHPRTLVHLTSRDLRHWTDPRPLKLSSDRVIDASLMRLDNGAWRMWYNNELAGKSIYFADSIDLATWTDRGKAVTDQGGEGPKVFRWKKAFWMITDVWHGLAVYRSSDALAWVRQSGENLLETPGTGADDAVKGGHADVVVNGERAYLFYFTHPGRIAGEKKDGYEQRRSSIQVVELRERDGKLSCDRNKPTFVDLGKPSS